MDALETGLELAKFAFDIGPHDGDALRFALYPGAFEAKSWLAVLFNSI